MYCTSLQNIVESIVFLSIFLYWSQIHGHCQPIETWKWRPKTKFDLVFDVIVQFLLFLVEIDRVEDCEGRRGPRQVNSHRSVIAHFPDFFFWFFHFLVLNKSRWWSRGLLHWCPFVVGGGVCYYVILHFIWGRDDPIFSLFFFFFVLSLDLTKSKFIHLYSCVGCVCDI